VFLDEPTAGVDVELRRDMWEMVRKLRDGGVTIILTTHYIEEAEDMADRIGVISKGELILVEEKAALMKKLGKKQLTVELDHAMSAIPSELASWNLVLKPGGHTLQREFDCPVGYSGHEVGLSTSVAAVSLGACMIERHITLDRAMWGSDQAASIEIPGLQRLIRDIRQLPVILGDGIKQRYPSEEPIRKKLRRVDSLTVKESE
jgi:sialic acid synthase SpsE